MSRSEILARARELLDQSKGCLEFIDGMLEADIQTRPRFGSSGRVTLSFSCQDGSRLTEGDLRHELGQLYYRSHTAHDPVLVLLGKHLQAGHNQPPLLDDAGEVAFGLTAAPKIEPGQTILSFPVSVVLHQLIDRVNIDHQRAVILPAMMDALTPLSRDRLIADLAADIEPDQVAIVLDMPEQHGAAMLRWFARGLD